MYQLEIQSPMGWHTLARYERLFDAQSACQRAALSEKCASRVVELLDDNMSLMQLASDGVVYEQFYNPRMDPDENWREEYKDEYEEDNEGLNWRKDGF